MGLLDVYSVSEYQSFCNLQALAMGMDWSVREGYAWAEVHLTMRKTNFYNSHDTNLNHVAES